MADCAIIFDVDGVLLELTRDEEEIFFTALSKFVPTQNLSRDWNSYKIRNDEDIIAEILQRNHLHTTLKAAVTAHYITMLKSSAVKTVAISGAAKLLQSLQGKAKLGIATANMFEAAKHRLQQVELWKPVSEHAKGADGGGHKSAILSRTIESFVPSLKHIIYIGDNLNDLAAAKANDVEFIGFSEDAMRRALLSEAGAAHITANHLETIHLLNQMLA